MTRPGDRLRAMAARMCGDKTMERLIDPLVADMQTEDAEALRIGRMWRSRWVRMSGYVAFLKVIALCALEGSIRTLHDGTADDRQALRRTIGFSISGMVVATLLLTVLGFADSRGWTQTTPVNQVRFLLFLVPRALTIALPVGLLMGILQGSAGRPISRRSQGTLLLMALVCSVASFATLAWLIPAGSQAYWGRIVARDQFPGELPIGELRQRIDSYAGTPMAGSSLVRNLKLTYHQTWALSGATLVFALFALAVVPRRRVWRFVPLVAACGVYCAYYTVLWKARNLGMSGTLSPFVAAWFPNVVLALAALGLFAVASRRSAATV
jgi:hypothetical protein